MVVFGHKIVRLQGLANGGTCLVHAMTGIKIDLDSDAARSTSPSEAHFMWQQSQTAIL